MTCSSGRDADSSSCARAADDPYTPSGRRRESRQHLLLARRLKHVHPRELLRLRIPCLPDPCRGIGEIVRRVPKRDARAKLKPVCTRSAERHADAAGVDDSVGTDRAIKLHVRMSADDDGFGSGFEVRRQLSSRRATCDGWKIAHRCRVTEQDATNPVDLDMYRERPCPDVIRHVVRDFGGTPTQRVLERRRNQRRDVSIARAEGDCNSTLADIETIAPASARIDCSGCNLTTARENDGWCKIS